MTANDIHEHLQRLKGWGGVYVKEFTYHDLRLDSILIDTNKRWIEGFEIKISRSDFLQDKKWHLYTKCTSSLSIVCPEGLIQAEEIIDPFGLLWVTEQGHLKWKKKAKNFQYRQAMAWIYQYMDVLETEMPRLMLEIRQLRHDVKNYELVAKKSA